jgi:3-oxoacyl-[acyl-carrier-protein] synthase III
MISSRRSALAPSVPERLTRDEIEAAAAGRPAGMLPPALLRGAGIYGIGSYLPERVLTNADLERMVETSDEWILTRTGISERRIVGENEATSDLAFVAARRALDHAGLAPADLDLVIVATVTPDMLFPSVSSIVQDRLGATRAGAFDLGAACSGFIYGLATAAQFVQTGLYRHVLVVGADALSRWVNWKDRSTCVLFGDGAGAAVVGPVAPGQGMLSFDLGSDGSGGDLLRVEAGGSRLPASAETVAQLQHTIQMDGREVFKFAVRVIEDSTRRALERAGLSTADIDCFIAHQANIRILDAAAKRLELPVERVFNNVSRYGNTSAASVPIAMVEALAEARFRKGDTLALVGFGAGLSWASTILTWTR